MKRLFLYASMLLLTASFGACSNDDDAAGPADDKDEISAEEIGYGNVCQKLLEMKIEGNDTSFAVANAAQVDITGKVYTVIVDNSDAAERYFKSFCVPSNSDFATKKDGNKTIADFGKYGKVEFVPVNGAGGTWATVNVRLACLKSALTIVLAESDGNATSPYEIGDIVEYDGKVWLCTIRYSGGGQMGRLMRFGNLQTYTVRDHFKTVCLSKDCADAVAIDGFIGLMQDVPGLVKMKPGIIKQFEDNASYGKDNRDVMLAIGRSSTMRNNVFMVSEMHNEVFCYSCGRNVQKLMIDYFTIENGMIVKGTTSCKHEFNGIKGVNNPFFNTPQTEQVVFDADGLPEAKVLNPVG